MLPFQKLTQLIYNPPWKSVNDYWYFANLNGMKQNEECHMGKK